MKQISIYMLVAVMLFGSISCEEQLDINTDPLASPTAELLLPGILARYQSRKETELGTRIMDVSQHFSACFNSPRQGITTSFLTGNTWGMYYTIFLGNLNVLEQDSRAIGDTRNNFTGIALTLKALGFYELSMIFEDIPFTEALDPQQFPFPAFDSQEVVLKGVVDLLDEAVTFLNNADDVVEIGPQDFIYNGDVELWERFANSLQLRVLMIIRNVDAAYANPRITDVLTRPLITELSHRARFPFFQTVGQQNSFADLNNTFFGTPSNEVAGVYSASPALRNLMVDIGDPRLDLFLTDINGGDDFDVPPLGSFSFGAFGGVVADDIVRFDAPAVWFTPAETWLYQAELAASNDISGDADFFTQEGVRRALQYWGGTDPVYSYDNPTTVLDATVIDNYVATFTGVTLEQIHQQQYLETFMRPIVSWNHVRRTRVPTLDLVPGAVIDDFLQRFSYPPDETATNENTPAPLESNAVTMWAFPR